MPTTPTKVIVIMAGGSGTRLWPLSRTTAPKQFQPLLSEKTLLQNTFERCVRIVPQANIFVSTNEQYIPLVQRDLPTLPIENILSEPALRNTAPAIILSASMVQEHFPEALIATVHADHAIVNEDVFVETLEHAFVALSQNPTCLITIGINPTRPDTGFGYIQIGEEHSVIENNRVFEIKNFKEKPDAKTAEKYFASWEYLWNAGYFLFTAERLKLWTEQYAPHLTALFANPQSVDYSTLPSEPIEPLIIEKLSPAERLVLPSALEWSDVGNWSTLLEELQKIQGCSVPSLGTTLDLDSHNSLIHNTSKKLVATIGLKDIVVVETNDALLVAHKDAVSTDIKQVLEEIKRQGRTDLL